MVKKAKSSQPKPVPIVHMVLDYDLAAADRDTDAMKRIKAINKYLGSKENALVEKRLRNTPLASLLTGKNPAIGGEEFMAAQDIELAFMSISGAVMFKPLNMERVDKSNGDRPLPIATAKAIERYQAWANHWSARKKRGDFTLRVITEAIIDLRPFSQIEADLCMSLNNGIARKVTIAGLRDYAARAGWAGPHTNKWIADAEKSFPVRDPNRIVHAELKRSIERARCPSPDLREAS